jgi:malate synthase
MEDAATAEISRAQVWQWIHHRVQLADSTVITRDLVIALVDSEMSRIASEVGASRIRDGRFADARTLFLRTATATTIEEFLTLPAYPMLEQDAPAVAVMA